MTLWVFCAPKATSTPAKMRPTISLKVFIGSPITPCGRQLGVEPDLRGWVSLSSLLLQVGATLGTQGASPPHGGNRRYVEHEYTGQHWRV